jgi:protein O-GlcNAc transferase
MTLDEAITTAVGLHQAGSLDEAEALYRAILAVVPEHSDINLFLGMLLFGSGRRGEAEPCFRQAVTSVPDSPEPHAYLADILIDRGKREEALVHYRRAIELGFETAPLHFNIGVILQELDRPGEADPHLRAAIRLHPDFTEAHNTLGNGLVALGRTDEAEACFRRAIELRPDAAAAILNLGNIFKHRGDLVQAASCYRQALDRQPDSAEAHMNLGTVLRAQGDRREALACYQRALALLPDSAEVYHALGHVLSDVGRMNEAADHYRQAIRLRPDFAAARTSLGSLLCDIGDQPGAQACFERALEIKPDSAEACQGLGLCLFAQGLIDEALAALERALEINPHLATSHGILGNFLTTLGRPDEAAMHFRKAIELKPDSSDIYRQLLLSLTYDPSLGAGERFAEHRRFESMHARPHYPASVAFANSPEPGRRLRIGYLSSDFGNHPVGHNLLPVLEAHDPGAVELFLYASMRSDDPMTGRFKDRADCWRPVIDLNDRQVADLIRADGIDILVILAGRFDGNRPLVAAHRPAPVQVSFHDPATSGMEVMDAIITDPVLTPRRTTELFAERPFRLPSFYIHSPIADAPPVVPPPILAKGHPTFGSLNNPAKLSEPTLALWAEVLRRIPDARLMLKYKELYHSAPVARRITGIFAGHGIDPARIDMRGAWDDREAHLALYHDIDIALDPFPFNGSTTTFEALWMGVPVVTLLGNTMVSRWAASMLTALKLTGQVAASPADYVDICQRLVSDPDALAALRAGLRGRVAASPLCRPQPKARQIERAYRTLWRRWCASSQGQGRHDP